MGLSSFHLNSNRYRSEHIFQLFLLSKLSKSKLWCFFNTSPSFGDQEVGLTFWLLTFVTYKIDFLTFHGEIFNFFDLHFVRNFEIPG